MTQLKLFLKTLTPTFIAGAEPRGSPELRAASIRGAARYWLRAALGSQFGDNSVELLKAESDVFGSTTQASPVSIRVVPINDDKVKTHPFMRQPSVRAGKSMKTSGRDYLYWSMAESGRVERGNYLEPKQYFDSGAEFEIKAAFSDENAQTKFRALAALWLLSRLGGVGSRSRRTGGSIDLHCAEDLGLLFAFTPAPSIGQLREHLVQGIGEILKQIGGQNQSNQYDTLSKTTSKIWLLSNNGQAWRNDKDAVEAIGAKFRDFRAEVAPHEDIPEWFDKGEKPKTVARAAFGLPLPFHYPDGGPTDVLQGSEHDRRSSPLWLRVSQLADGGCVGVATLFTSALLDKGEKLQFARSRRNTEPPADYKLICDFIKWEQANFKPQEVALP